ncbi:GGDEF domain-containing phosphodiesterase [Pigmentiphaga soli]
MLSSPGMSSFAQQLGAITERRVLLRELSELISTRRRAAVLVMNIPGHSGTPNRDELVRRIRPFIRLDDMMGLMDDGSLVVLLRNIGEKANAIGAAQRLFQRCELLQIIGRSDCEGFVSFGIVMLPSDIEDAGAVLSRARKAARYASRTRARWVCWSDGPEDLDSALLSREDTLATEVIQGLERGEFELFYQPQLEMRDGRLRGLEALIRWRRGDALVLPATFIPSVESAGLSAALGSWVLRRACRQLADWRQGVVCPRIAVNMSAVQLQGDLVDLVWHILAEYQVRPDQIEIELTESSEVVHPEEAFKITRQLAEMGIGFSLDDFGTGYSSFLRLKSAPFHAVKIERQFVAGMLDDNYDREMLRAVIDFGRKVGIQTIAEGVETPQQLQALRAMGCDAWQGFLCSPPMDVESATRFLQAARIA